MKKPVVLCGLMAVILGGCAISLGEDFIISRDTKEKGAYIVDYNLQTYVPVPVPGEQAVKQITRRGDVEAIVTWKDQDGNELPTLGTFQADTVYQAEIKLTPREGYLFNSSINFAYPLGNIQSDDDRRNPTRTVQVIYTNSNANSDDSSGDNGNSGGGNGNSSGDNGDSGGGNGNSGGGNGNSGGDITPSQVTLTNLAAYIPAPVTGNVPVLTLSTTEYTGSVTWDPAENPFKVNTAYTATVTLNANERYFFVPAVFTHAGASSIQVSGGEDRVTIIMDFQETTIRVVDDTDLPNSVTYPSIGAPPDTIFRKTSSQYTSSAITWRKVGSPAEVSSFVSDEEYKATVILTAAEGFTFTGTAGFNYTFNNTNITTVVAANTGNTVTVDISFPALALVIIGGGW